MQPGTDFMTDIAEFDLHPGRLLWRAEFPEAPRFEAGAAIFSVPFRAYRLQGALVAAPEEGLRRHDLRLEYLEGGMLRLRIDFAAAGGAGTAAAEESPMLAEEGLPPIVPLSAGRGAEGDIALYARGQKEPCVLLPRKRPPSRTWSDLIPPAPEDFAARLFPCSAEPRRGEARFASWDQFFPGKLESVALGYLEDSSPDGRSVAGTLFSFAAGPEERFAGTGERFGRLDLSGRTVVLENNDALGVNSRRAYKNIPFYLSSAGYGVFVHDSVRMVLSFADVSTRAVQGFVASAGADLFVFSGTPERILNLYRRVTGFPPELPLWSYGVWVAKMTYFSAREVEGVVDRMRAEDFPMDVAHLDTGWFEKDWVCEWRFSAERFPDPAGFMAALKSRGVRVSLWQTPNIGEGNMLLEEAKAEGYLAPPAAGAGAASDFSGQDFGGQIDFTNPRATAWYRGLLRRLFDLGASAIKTDFGEKIDMGAAYHGMDARKLRNLYALLYQRAAFQETRDALGQGLIWARAAWAGCQRYPLHWGGDAAATWDGLAASVRGGLQFGMSGFAYWASDVGGFHGLPEFMNDGPDDELYLRWTQAMVFASHFRYHGTSDREPYAFPAVAKEVRAWLKFRYALIPYLRWTGEECARSGFPVMRALALAYPEDPEAWAADTQFLCGADLLVAPVLGPGGFRSVYLPEGEWVDLWTGSVSAGPRRLPPERSPLGRIPVYGRRGAVLPLYGAPLRCTDEMEDSRIVELRFDSGFSGIGSHPVGRLCGLR